MRRHGEIFTELSLAPPIHEGCRCSYLEFSSDELGHYREKAERMRARAEEELERRRLFHRGEELLGADPKRALELFQLAAEIEVYLDEVEELCRRDSSHLATRPNLAKRLQDILIYGYQNKFTKKKYEHVPEGMRWARESWGVQRIKELFHDLVALR
ncbi:TPA: hypothetical protein EYP37_03505 [Candidatus Poribacteria bacterium]|nr:hypothetical protein [Candidatus Poribacteria bacterium]